jgi:predicted DNA-binding transcriptional regulator AlpA
MKSTDLDLLDRRGACQLFGDIHVATLYRHVRAGLIPKPIHVGGSSRWLRSECESALAKMAEARQ